MYDGTQGGVERSAAGGDERLGAENGAPGVGGVKVAVETGGEAGGREGVRGDLALGKREVDDVLDVGTRGQWRRLGGRR